MCQDPAQPGFPIPVSRRQFSLLHVTKFARGPTQPRVQSVRALLTDEGANATRSSQITLPSVDVNNKWS